MTKTYNFNRVTYRFSPRNRAWTFDRPTSSGQTYTFIRSFSGRQPTAERIAKLIDGSFERRGELDNPTRANINRLIEAASAKA